MSLSAWSRAEGGEADARRRDGLCVLEVEDDGGQPVGWVATRGGKAGMGLAATDLAGARDEADRRWPLREGA